MEVGLNFDDIKSYASQMSRAVDDKLFYLNHMETNDFIVLDFGCADATILNQLERRCSDCLGCQGHFQGYIGYDISETMIEMAKTKWEGKSENVVLTSNWLEVMRTLHNWKVDHPEALTITVLSSVIHEVYSYNTEKDFWKRVFEADCDCVAFRDMMWSSTEKNPLSEDWYLNYTVKSVQKDEKNKDLLESFERKWGSITDIKNLTHYLLKYRWRINWERENNENYFPITLSYFLSEMGQKYEPQYLERFSVPFIESQIRKDFGVDFHVKTHVKIWFKKRI